MITRAQRKAIREAGPLHRYDSVPCSRLLRNAGGDWVVAFSDRYGRAAEDALMASHNAVASEPESVAVARERLLRVARLDSSTSALITAAHAYQTALRAAKKTRKR